MTFTQECNICHKELFWSDIYHQYTISTQNRDQIFTRLKKANIGCAIYYPSPLTDFDVYNDDKTYPVASETCKNVLSLPMGPFLTSDEVEQVCDIVMEVD